MINVIQTDIPGVFIIEPKVFGDDRGYFLESWNQKDFDEMIRPITFVQDNESKSRFGVLRGLHYQKGKYAQSKLVRVVKGRVLDVAVDIRCSTINVIIYTLPNMKVLSHGTTLKLELIGGCRLI